MDKTGKILFISIIALILLKLISGFLPENLLWGIDFWRYIPHGFILMIGLIILYTALFWLGARWLKTPWEKIRNSIPNISRVWIALAAAIGAAIIFYLFRVKIYLLGDGYIVTRALERNELAHSLYKEPLDIVIHWVVFKAVLKIASIEAAQIYSAISILSGAFFVFIIAYFIKYITNTPNEKWLTYLSLCFTGTILLFFGYVESYTIVNVLLMGFFISSLKCIQEKQAPLIPSFLLGLSICFHLSAGIFIPVLLYLWIFYLINVAGFDTKIILGLKGIAAFISPMFALILIYKFMNYPLYSFYVILMQEKNFLPLNDYNKPFDAAYSIFSFPHLLDIINEIYLIAPLFLLFLIIMIPLRKKIFSHRNQQWIFLTISLIVSLICIVGFNLKKGASRDWDLFASLAIPLTLFALYSISLVKIKWNSTMSYVLSLFLFIHIIPWIMVNSNNEWYLNRIEAMTEDPKWSMFSKADAFDELRSYYQANGEGENALSYARLAASTHENYRYYANLAYIAKGNGFIDEAIMNYQKALGRNPEHYTSYIRLGELLVEKKEYEDALEVFEKGKEKFNSAIFYMNSAYVLNELNRIDEAIANYKQALEIEPDNYDFNMSYAEMLLQNNKDDEALTVLDKVNIKFKNIEVIMRTAEIAEKLNRYDEAITNYKRAIGLNPAFCEPYFKICRILYKKKDFNGALVILGKAEKYCRSPELYYNIALMKKNLNRYSEAKQAAQKALKLNPELKDALDLMDKLKRMDK
ncbi:tetratricopeptide repeat protein [bacterium]|nr:tetratricopeptide repeat protein [bacterium]